MKMMLMAQRQMILKSVTGRFSQWRQNFRVRHLIELAGRQRQSQGGAGASLPASFRSPSPSTRFQPTPIPTPSEDLESELADIKLNLRESRDSCVMLRAKLNYAKHGSPRGRSPHRAAEQVEREREMASRIRELEQALGEASAEKAAAADIHVQEVAQLRRAMRAIDTRLEDMGSQVCCRIITRMIPATCLSTSPPTPCLEHLTRTLTLLASAGAVNAMR